MDNGSQQKYSGPIYPPVTNGFVILFFIIRILRNAIYIIQLKLTNFGHRVEGRKGLVVLRSCSLAVCCCARPCNLPGSGPHDRTTAGQLHALRSRPSLILRDVRISSLRSSTCALCFLPHAFHLFSSDKKKPYSFGI